MGSEMCIRDSKNAGHWVHSEQPEIFTETLRRFLVSIGS